MIRYLILLAIVPCLGRWSTSSTNTDLQDPIYEKLTEFISKANFIGDKINLSFTDSIVYEIEASYLGVVQIKPRGRIKILTVRHFTGLFRDALRARGEILVFDYENKIIGKYQIGHMNDLPTEIISESKLLFSPSEECNLKTITDFTNELPDILFVKCTEVGGNLYKFLPHEK